MKVEINLSHKEVIPILERHVRTLLGGQTPFTDVKASQPYGCNGDWKVVCLDQAEVKAQDEIKEQNRQHRAKLDAERDAVAEPAMASRADVDEF